MAPRTDHRFPLQQRSLALAGAVAPAVFALGVVVAGLSWSGYSHRAQNISDLGGTAAPYAMIQNVNFVVFGLLVVVLATGLRRSLVGRRGAAAGPWLVGYFGVTVVVLGSVPCTPGCAEGTPADVVHELAALTGVLAFILATLLVWRRARSEPSWTGYGTYSAFTGLFTLAFVAAWIVAGAVDPEQWHAGALQRLFFGAVLVWLGVTGARLLRVADTRSGSVAPGPGA